MYLYIFYLFNSKDKHSEFSIIINISLPIILLSHMFNRYI